MSVMAETSQSAMGPYVAMAAVGLALYARTAVCREALVVKVPGGDGDGGGGLGDGGGGDGDGGEGEGGDGDGGGGDGGGGDGDGGGGDGGGGEGSKTACGAIGGAAGGSNGTRHPTWVQFVQ